MSREKSYKQIISSSHRIKIAKLETEMIMKSFDNQSGTFASTSIYENTQAHAKSVVDNDNYEILNKSASEESLSNQDIRILQDFDSNNIEIDTKSNNTNNKSDSKLDSGSDSRSDSRSNQNINFKKFLAHWAVKERISQSSLRSLLKGIKQYTCKDCCFNIPSDPRSLVCTPRNTNIDICAGDQYYHFGLSEAILSVMSSIPQNITNIKLTINIDGLPLSKSSQRQFWPILGSITESKYVFIIGIYYGTQKPSNPNEFLKKFVEDAKILCKDGIIINNKNIPCMIEAIICDAPAKSFILQIKGHNGYSSCTKCITEGSYINGKMCFPEINAELRTDKDFRLRKDENYHVGDSVILEIPNLDLVRNIPLDYMHLVCLGVTRKLLYMWLFGELKVRLQNRKVEAISLQLEQVLKLYIPCEFVRKTRSLVFVKLWKATEFRNFLLYIGPIVLKPFLQKNLYNNFLTLHVAIRILCCLKFQNFIDYAQELLQHFISSFALLYGTHNISHNVHGLIHLVQDVKRFGPLDGFSSFKFENYLQIFKKLLKKHDKPLQQVVRRYIEHEQNDINKANNSLRITSSHFIDFKSIHTNGPLVEGCCNPQYKIIRCLNTTVRIDTLADNCCGLTDGSIVEVKNIAQHKEHNINVIIGNQYCHKEDLYDIPCHSSLIGIFAVHNLSEELKIWPIENIKTKYVKLPLDNNNRNSIMEDIYSIVEFEDGLQMIPNTWLTENKAAAYWPQFTSHARFSKAVQKRIPYDNSWHLYDVKKILATAKTYEKGLVKLKKAEFISDINSESDVSENFSKKSRKNRAKKIMSSSDDNATDNEGIQLPSFPTIPQTKTTYNKKFNKYNDKLKQQLTENITTIYKEKELEKSSMNNNISKMKKNKIYNNLVADNNEDIIDKDENILYNDKSFDKSYKSNNDANSSSSDFQRYIIRKLTDIGFKISSLYEQQKLFINSINTTLEHIETFDLHEKNQNKEIDEHLMNNFPMDNIEDLEQFEKLLIEGSINHKKLIKQLSRIGGNNIRGVTFNLLRRLMSDKLANNFSYVGGKKKRVFYDLQLRKIIFNVIQNQFVEATEYCIAEPIKSWLRHASERLKKNGKEVKTIPGMENNE